MEDKRPKRRKDKYNPYTIYERNGHYYVSFEDGQKVSHMLEINKILYKTFDSFELDDLVYLNVLDRHIEQSEVWESTLNGPVLVIQNNRGNRHSPTVIVAAVTSRPKHRMSTHVPLKGFKGLEKDSVVLLEQMRTIDKKRLDDYVGALDRQQMRKVEKALCASTGMRKLDKPILLWSLLFVTYFEVLWVSHISVGL